MHCVLWYTVFSIVGAHVASGDASSFDGDSQIPKKLVRREMAPTLEEKPVAPHSNSADLHQATDAEDVVAEDFESLHLVDSDIDVDAVAKKHKQQAFQMKVTGPSGQEVCLSEVRNGYGVRALKCADRHGQQWYWDGKKIKNLNSEQRCLGYSIHATGRHPMSMYDCQDDSMFTAWIIDEHGRLKSNEGDECMAFNQEEHKNAVTLPCGH